MRIVRFSIAGKVRYGVWENDVVHGLRRSPFATFEAGGKFATDGSAYPLSDIKLLAPCEPSKLVCLGLNYRSHIEEIKMPWPKVPLLFLKPSTAVIGPDDYILLPELPAEGRVDYEGEVGVVIGKRAKDVTGDRALDYVLGYTCVNDVTERHAQKSDGQWTRAKGYDTFAPIGPCIQTEADPKGIKIETYLNGEKRQCGNTSDLLFGVTQLISFISGVMTLLPGDIISTGTPSGIGQMRPGDVVEVRVEGVGTLRNCVKAK